MARCVGKNRRGGRCRNWFAEKNGIGDGWYDDPCLCPTHNTQENRINPVEWVKAQPEGLPEKYPFVWVTREEAGGTAI